jgi:aryl-alcohol dehydrogenase-like predicted oxidoreductase
MIWALIKYCSQDETSEMIIGEWAEKRGIRDQLFIATKVWIFLLSSAVKFADHYPYGQYSTNYKRGNGSVAQQIQYVGNSNKSLRISVRDSLKKLRTDYIDLFYLHWWDFQTSIEEVMRSLHALVQAGKVLYLVRLLSCDSSFRIMTDRSVLYRVSLIRQLGSSLVRTSMPVTTHSRLSSFTKVNGMSSSVISSVKSFPWLVRRVCIIYHILFSNLHSDIPSLH